MSTLLRSAAWALIPSVSILLMAALTAQATSNQVHRYSILEAKSLTDRTVTVGGEIYRLSMQSALYDLEGRKVGLRALRPFDVHSGLFNFDDATKVEIQASRIGDKWVLDWLKEISEIPQ